MPGFAAVSRMAPSPTSRSTNVSTYNPSVSNYKPSVPTYSDKEFKEKVWDTTRRVYNDMAIINPVLGRELYRAEKGRDYLIANCFKKIDNPTDGIYKSPCVKSVDCLMTVTLKGKEITREYGGVTLTDESLTTMNKRRDEIEKEIDSRNQDFNTLGKKLARLEIDKKLNCFPTEYWQPYSKEEIESKEKIANEIFNRGQYKPLVLKGSLSKDKRYYRFCPKSFNGVAELNYVKTISSTILYNDDENTPYYALKQSYRETDGGPVIEQIIVLPEGSTIMSRGALTSYFQGKSATVRGGKRKRRTYKRKAYHKS